MKDDKRREQMEKRKGVWRRSQNVRNCQLEKVLSYGLPLLNN